MEIVTKKRLLIGIIVILVVINISALSTIAFHKYKYSRIRNIEQRDNFKQQQENKGLKQQKNYHSRVKQFVRRELELSDEQFEQYSKLKDINMEETHEIMQQIGQKKQLIFKEFCKENKDTMALTKLTKEIGQLHITIQKETLRHFNAIEEILSPDQQIKFRRMLCKMADRKGNAYNKKFGKNKKDCR